jgi:transcription elongation factor GreB
MTTTGEPQRFITPEGHARLRDELLRLWRVERPRVTQEVSDAAALGDRSENAEYIYGKRRLREIDRRLRYLSQLLDRLTVVRFEPEQRGRAYFGAWVTVEDDEGAERRFRLVGPDELDVRAGLVSIDSPMGRALLGRAVGDEVSVQRPKGRARLAIVAIEYQEDAAAGDDLAGRDELARVRATLVDEA